MSNRGWWRDCFEDHPEASQRSESSYANPQAKDKRFKGMCKLCLEARIQSEQQIDIDNGRIVRSRETIVSSLWAWDPSSQPRGERCPWIQVRPETLLRHLKNCPEKLPDHIRQAAENECIRKGWISTTAGGGSSNSLASAAGTSVSAPLALGPISMATTGIHDAVAPPFIQVSANALSTSAPPARVLPSIQAATSSALHPSTMIETPSPMSESPGGLGLLLQLPFSNASPSLSPSSQFTQNFVQGSVGSESLSAPVSLVPSPAVSPSLPTADGFRPSKRMRVLSRTLSGPVLVGSPNAIPAPWARIQQDHFASHMARITASCGFPFNWIENPSVRDFLDKFLPNATPISSYQLSHRYIPQEVDKFRAAAKESSRGTAATLQTDGWTGINFRHLIALMITTSRRQVHTVRVVDETAERKTASNLRDLLVNVIENIERDWQLKIVAVTSDASGESRAARKQLVNEFPYLVAPDCYAHQINLVVGDYFKASSSFIYTRYTKKATELITWLRSKTLALAILRDIQVAVSTTGSNPGRVLSVIRAVLTRWTAHYLAFRRLLDLKFALDILYRQEFDRPAGSQRIIIGDRAAQNKAREMLLLTQNPTLWSVLVRTVKHLEPLALATNFAQAAHCRVDEVLVMFGYLTAIYTTMRRDSPPEDIGAIKAILESLEKRWSKTDQDIFIAAIILNPIYKSQPFAQLGNFTNAGMYGLLSKLWQRFYRSDPPISLYSELIDYLNDTGTYKAFQGWVRAIKQAAETKGERADPLKMYEGIQFSNQELSPLQQLAHRLFSICANSASCERLFSIFGNILTKLRSRLGLENMVNLAELRLHLRDEYVRKGDIKTQLQRKRKIISAAERDAAMTATRDTGTQAITETASPSGSTFAADFGLNSNFDTTSSSGFRTVVPTQPVGNTNETFETDEHDETSFSFISNSLQERIRADESLNDGDDDFSEVMDKIPLRILFNFSDSTWCSMVIQMGMRSLNDELEFYELLDVRAVTEDDVDTGVDDLLASAM